MWLFSYDFWGNSNFGGWVESVALPGALIFATQHVLHRRRTRHAEQLHAEQLAAQERHHAKLRAHLGLDENGETDAAGGADGGHQR